MKKTEKRFCAICGELLKINPNSYSPKKKKTCSEGCKKQHKKIYLDEYRKKIEGNIARLS